METLPARSEKTRTTETTSMVWIKFYPDDRHDRVKFEAIIWKILKHSQKMKTIEGCQSYSRNRGEIWPGRH